MKIIFLAVFACKVACIDDRFRKPAALYRVKNAVNKFIETILKEYDYCEKINVGYVIIYLLKKIKKIRDHDQITGKYRGSAHKNWNINLKLTENVHVIFHNLRGYGRHLIMQEIHKFDFKKVLYQLD